MEPTDRKLLGRVRDALRLKHRSTRVFAHLSGVNLLMARLLHGSGLRLMEWWATLNGYLQDYTHLIEGLLEMYQTTFDPRWYRAAHELAETMIEPFGAAEGFYDTSDDHETLIVRPRELQDNAVPLGNGTAAPVLLRLAGLAVEPRYLELAWGALGSMQWMQGSSSIPWSTFAIELLPELETPLRRRSRPLGILGP